MRSCWSGPLAAAKHDKSIKAESIADSKDIESPADSGDSAFLVLNGSIKLAMDSSRPFVIGRWHRFAKSGFQQRPAEGAMLMLSLLAA